MNYCSECGNKLVIKESEANVFVPYCDACGRFYFPMYNVAVSMIVRRKDDHSFLLIQQYGRRDNILVAGYVNIKEDLLHACHRELMEETNLKACSIEFNASKYYEPSNTLICNFIVYVDNPFDLKVNEEVDAYGWFKEEEVEEAIKPNSLAKEFLLCYLKK